jgi:hypothetical protein
MEASIEMKNDAGIEDILKKEFTNEIPETEKNETIYEDERMLHAENIDSRLFDRRKKVK